MSVYMTEDEQLDAIKKWWKRHGNLVTGVISIALLCVAGYRYMHWHNEKITQQASSAYEQMMVALSNHDNKSVRSYANQLVKDYKATVYADAAHMTLAKIYVSKDKPDNAKDELMQVVNNTRMPALKQVAKLRIARILAVQKRYPDALAQLSTIDDSAYSPAINELKGDIYGATGKYTDALNAYRLAIAEVKSSGMGNLFLEMKSNDLAIQAESSLPNDKKVQAA